MSATAPTGEPSLARLSALIGLGFFATVFTTHSRLARLPLQAIIKDQLGLDEMVMATFFALSATAWSFRPLAGALDYVPLFGTRRRHYLLLSALGGAAIWAVTATLPRTADHLLAAMIALNFVLVLGNAAIGGLLVDSGRVHAAAGRLSAIRVTVTTGATLIAGPIGGWLGVCASHWASGYVDAAYKLKMLDPPLLTEGRFDPDAPISRQEAAYLLVEASKGSKLSTFAALRDEHACFELHPSTNPYEEQPGEPPVGAAYLDAVLATTSLRSPHPRPSATRIRGRHAARSGATSQVAPSNPARWIVSRRLQWSDADRDKESGMKANRPTAPGLGSEHGPARHETVDARLRDLPDVSKIRIDSVAILSVSETAPRKRARIWA